MAGDWIKFELSTFEKTEIYQIAESSGIDEDAVIGKLLRVWGWFDQQTESGNAMSVSKKLLDRLCGVTGFCDHMIKAGWMTETGDGSAMTISLPNFDRHNGKTAKNRALTAKRVALHKVNASLTHDALPREEKRREEKKESKPKVDKFDAMTMKPENVSEQVWAEWCQARTESRKPLTKAMCTAQAKQLAGHANADEVIRKSIAAGWQGLFPDSVKSSSARHGGFDQIDYMDGLTVDENGSLRF